ncbi:hypothetical protein QFZ30_002673 [Arthrobacter pascens]|uniref:ScyD/ScyE family protein n=1 Tax=Arthrobacter pascens TaxID=1677 RepID=UPI00279132D0|nr:ScyD/ScyE family protein [Arthrobacter pascens]MDQ0679291.1 hypothetical protein [Arthrobacter pascens]
MYRKTTLLACLAVAAMLLPASPAAAADSPSTPETLAEGLVSPLRLALGADETVLVTQTFAGTLSRVKDDDDGHGQEPLTDLYTNPGWSVGGVETSGETAFFVESLGAGGGDPAALEGYLKSINARGEVRTVAELATLERSTNPDGFQHYGFGPDASAECLAQASAIENAPPAQYMGAIDSHPYATAVSGNTVYVADAGANSITEVNVATGAVSTLAVLPPRPATITADAAAALGIPGCVGFEYAFEPVPTDVEIGPDGWLYVSSLPGGPEDPSLGARGAIFRVNPWTGTTRLWAEDILSPTGLAVADNGDVYVASMFGGEIIKIDAGTGRQSQFLAENTPADVEISGETLYATVEALGDPTAPPAGRVIEVDIR